MDVPPLAESRYAEESKGQLWWKPGIQEGGEWLPKWISGLVNWGIRRHQGGGKPETVLWAEGAPWAGWKSWSGREEGDPCDNPKRYPPSMGQRPAMMGQLLACSLKRESLTEKAKPGNWGCQIRVQVVEGEGQTKCLGGSLDHAWWIGPNSPGEGWEWGKRHILLQSASSETALMSWNATYE